MTETIEGELITMEGTPNLNAALAAVQARLPYVGKDETADTGSYQYKYADLSAVSAAIMPLLGSNGLAFTAWPSVNDQGKFVLRYELLHKSGECKAGEYPIGGGNAQQIGSAITYARRYTLCAVTGLAPGDDDDAAAAVGAREVERSEEQADSDRERHAALDAVRGAWFNQYGEWNPTAASDMFETWSHGAEVASANAKQLRAFAAYLHALPVAEAGSKPPEADPEQPADEQPDEPARPSQAREPLPLSGRARGKIFALMADLGISQRQAQLEYVTTVLGRTIKSRSEINAADADPLIKALEADLEQARQTGLVPDQPEAGGPGAE